MDFIPPQLYFKTEVLKSAANQMSMVMNNTISKLYVDNVISDPRSRYYLCAPQGGTADAGLTDSSDNTTAGGTA